MIAAALMIVLAAMFKAVADVLTFHFYDSVFKWKDRRFWDPNISWTYTPFLKFTKYRPDAWHLANSFMIVCFCLAVVICPPVKWWMGVPAAGVIYNLSFNIFYNKIFRKK